ncbi:MAG: CDP-alcohol phosphatidyltransferase family protein [Nannocystaceae bacterium]
MLRYVAPNLVTSMAMVLGLLSVVSSFEGNYVESGWFILWATFFDRVDGLVARTLKATSAFGVQMDSFADFLNFGVAPACLMYCALSSTEALPFTTGIGHTVIIATSVLWVLCATFRLARFNVLTDDSGDNSMFFGIPTTLAAGMLVNLFLVGLKYADPSNPLGDRAWFTEGHLFGAITLGPKVWTGIPIAMVIGALLMVSNLRMRKIGKLVNRKLNLGVSLLAITAMICGIGRVFPEYMVLLPSIWMAIWLPFGQLSPAFRHLESPPLFPVGSREPSGENAPAATPDSPAA